MASDREKQPLECERCGDGKADYWVTIGEESDPVAKRYVCESCRDWFKEEFNR